MIQGEAEGQEPLSCLGIFCSMTVLRKGMNVSLVGQTGKKDIGELQHQFLQASWWQHHCDVQLPEPAGSSCHSYSNHPNANHEFQLLIRCQLRPRLMPPKLPRICALKPREQPQPLLFDLALLAQMQTEAPAGTTPSLKEPWGNPIPTLKPRGRGKGPRSLSYPLVFSPLLP